ncbi:MAG: chromosomal replication initiator protein DnaA [Eubacteriales bacterium]|nr:chromosomal replication initiator protein DnaA [Eubacteriales bacterium]
MKHPNVQQLWDRAVALLDGEVSEISLNTWIKPMEPLSADQGVFILSVPNDFHKTFVEQYASLIRNALKIAGSFDYEVRFQIGHLDPPVQNLNYEPKAASVRNNNGESFSQTTLSRLNPQYTFDTFVVGSGNRFAHAASVAIAEKQGGRNFNPLFLYGGSGLGKTHLMHAIANFICANHPVKNILYVQCEQFVNEFIYTIRENKYDDFRSKYRNTDMLLIDDIQFIEGKEQMQIEFFHTFNALYETGKHIVMTCDKPPQSLASLEERLRTRFSSGLIVDIQPPDYETRLAILRRHAMTNNVSVPDDVYEYIASNVASNIRELEGAFKTVLYYSMLAGPITQDVAREALKDIIQPSAARKITAGLIMEVVSNAFNVSVDDLKSNRRSKEVAMPRQVSMFLCRSLLNMTLPQIGTEFGNRDHTTVMYACSKISEELAVKPDLALQIDDLKKRITG